MTSKNAKNESKSLFLLQSYAIDLFVKGFVYFSVIIFNSVCCMTLILFSVNETILEGYFRYKERYDLNNVNNSRAVPSESFDLTFS